MKPAIAGWLGLTLLALILALGLVAATPAQVRKAGEPDTNRVKVRFREVDTLLSNPGQGWMSQQQRPPRREPRFPCSVVYIRFDWADAEPEPGRINWGVIDNVIAAWKPRAAAVAFRVMTCNAHSPGYYASPKWLFDGGCNGFEYVRGGDDPPSGGKRITRIEPDYADPIYLARHGEFIAALGNRYDGHAAIEFLDIGSYGIWGEWHTSHPAPVSVRKQIVDMYLRAFRKTPLVFMSDDAEVLAYALAHGTGIRRDGVGSPWHEENWIGSKKYAGVPGMAEVWKCAPVVFEWFGDYAYLKSRGWSFEAAVNFMLKNHVTLINDNVGQVPPEAMPLLRKLARLAGARLVLCEIAHERHIAPGGTLRVSMKWANVGVSKLYRPYTLRLLLLDAAAKRLIQSDVLETLSDWLPGERTIAATLRVPASMQPGSYDLGVAVVDSASRRPAFKLAIDAPEKGGAYVVSRVAIH